MLEGTCAGLRRREVRVTLPRFKTTAEFGLKDTLVAMGMADAFDAGKADFSGMDGKKDLFISAVVHKAFVDVNEEGTEAAAATGVVMSLTAMPEPPPEFRADHPFLFLIRDTKTGAILFFGRILDPTK
jgi:serpin B